MARFPPAAVCGAARAEGVLLEDLELPLDLSLALREEVGDPPRQSHQVVDHTDLLLAKDTAGKLEQVEPVGHLRGCEFRGAGEIRFESLDTNLGAEEHTRLLHGLPQLPNPSCHLLELLPELVHLLDLRVLQGQAVVDRLQLGRQGPTEQLGLVLSGRKVGSQKAPSVGEERGSRGRGHGPALEMLHESLPMPLHVGQHVATHLPAIHAVEPQIADAGQLRLDIGGR